MSGPAKKEPESHFDPWSITGYLIAGMLVYGAAGWGLDHWLGTGKVFTPIGIVFGLAAGLYLTFRSLSVQEKQEREALIRKRAEYLPADLADAARHQRTDARPHEKKQDKENTQHD